MRERLKPENDENKILANTNSMRLNPINYGKIKSKRSEKIPMEWNKE